MFYRDKWLLSLIPSFVSVADLQTRWRGYLGQQNVEGIFRHVVYVKELNYWRRHHILWRWAFSYWQCFACKIPGMNYEDSRQFVTLSKNTVLQIDDFKEYSFENTAFHHGAIGGQKTYRRSERLMGETWIRMWNKRCLEKKDDQERLLDYFSLRLHVRG